MNRTEAVDDLLADPARRQTDGIAGREHVAAEYSFVSVVDADEAVFDRIDPASRGSLRRS